MRLPDIYHYSKSGIRSFEPREQKSESGFWMTYDKPKGLWITDNSKYNWHWWSTAESFRIDALCYRQKIILKPEANILLLKSDADLLDFTTKYHARHVADDRLGGIDWSAVAAEYDGIVITPYRWKLRLSQKTRWYYGWDCASGCIWGDVVERISRRTRTRSDRKR